VSLNCPSVHPYIVRPQKHFLNFNEIWHIVEVDEWCMTVCSMTQSKVKFKVMSPSKLEIRSFSKVSLLLFTVGAGNWPRIHKLGHSIEICFGQIFYICPRLFATWLRSWQKFNLRRFDSQSWTGLIYTFFYTARLVRERVALWQLCDAGTMTAQQLCEATFVSVTFW